jgi:hydrogenase maturation protease
MLAQPKQHAETQTQRRPTLVLGLGNILLRDEGVGVRVVEAMQTLDLPAGVELFDGATAGFDLIEALADRQRVIVIDAIAGDAEPGTVLRLTAADLAPAEHGGMSLHELGFVQTLGLARQLGVAPPEIVIFGIKPLRLDPGLELSPTIAAIVPEVVRQVVAELEKNAGARDKRHDQESEG